MSQYSSWSEPEYEDLQNIIDTVNNTFVQEIKQFMRNEILKLKQFSGKTFTCSVEIYIDEVIEEGV